MRQSLSRSYGCFIAEFLNASFPVHLGLLDHPTGVGLRYGFSTLCERWFSWKQKGTDSTSCEAIWGPCSTHPEDLPSGINALHVPRAVNAHALIFPLRHTAPRCKLSFFGNISPPLWSRRFLGFIGCSTFVRSSDPINVTNLQNLKTFTHKVVETEAPEALEHTPLAIILKYRNIDLLSIGYAFQPGLRTD